MSLRHICAMVASLFVLSGCIPAVITGASAVGYGAAQHRSMGTAVDDAKLHSQIKGNMVRHSASMFTSVDVDVHEGRVFLTGKVIDPQHRIEALRLAWLPVGVREVINEIQLVQKRDLKQSAKDTWITTKVKSQLFNNRAVRSINYGVDTINNVVYLFGLASSLQELESAKHTASTVKGVARVVSHVRVLNDPHRQKYVAE